MQQLTLKTLPSNGIGILVEDEISDKTEFNNFTLKNCRFLRLGLRDAKINRSVITQTQFEDCYLRNAQFDHVDLTGCLFRNCNLEKATFEGCTLKFCRFENTEIDIEDIISNNNLPTEANIKLSLVRNLRMNCTTLGDADAANKLLDLEIDAQTAHLIGIVQRKTHYYTSHYTMTQQIGGFFKLVGWWIDGAVWGYGRRLLRLAIAYIVITMLFALTTWLFHISLLTTSSPAQHVTMSFQDACLHAFGKTLGGVVSLGEPESTFGRLLQIGEALTGACFLALLTSSLYRRIAR